jgi:hypothetical protein
MYSLVTPEKLFLCYAFASAPARLRAGALSSEDFAELEDLVLRHGCPPRAVLERAFPDETTQLRQYGEIDHRAMWAIDTVAEYWRYHRELRGCTRVVHASVRKIISPTLVLVRAHNYEKKCMVKFRATNPYALLLRVREVVTIHQRTVIEQIDCDE